MKGWFEDIVTKDEQHEIQRAKVEIAWKCWLGALTARNLVTIIAHRFGEDAA